MQFLAGNQECTEKLIRAYQDEIVKSCEKKLNREDIFFGDLLQEGNMGLLTALERLSEQENPDEWIVREIESTMKLFIEEQAQQKKRRQYSGRKGQRFGKEGKRAYRR